MTFQCNEHSSHAIKQMLLMGLFLYHDMNQAFNNKSISRNVSIITPDSVKCRNILVDFNIYTDVQKNLCQNNLCHWDPFSNIFCSTIPEIPFNNSLRNSTDVGQQIDVVGSIFSSQQEGVGFYLGFGGFLSLKSNLPWCLNRDPVSESYFNVAQDTMNIRSALLLHFNIKN